MFLQTGFQPLKGGGKTAGQNNTFQHGGNYFKGVFLPEILHSCKFNVHGIFLLHKLFQNILAFTKAAHIEKKKSSIL